MDKSNGKCYWMINVVSELDNWWMGLLAAGLKDMKARAFVEGLLSPARVIT